MLSMIAFVICSALAIWSFLNPQVGTKVWIGGVWAVGILMYVQQRLTLPSASFAQKFFLGDSVGKLSDEEVRTFQRYHAWI